MANPPALKAGAPQGVEGSSPSASAKILWNECERKKFYATRSEADAMVMFHKSEKQKLGHQDRNLASYKCHFCPGYHIGHGYWKNLH